MLGARLSERYEILEELGRGGMGVVYRARDPKLNRDVAIKLISPNMLTPDAERRFKVEAQVVAGLDHPSIVPIHDFGQHEGSLFFVMPVVEGSSLRLLMREGSLSLGDILEIGIQTADALDYSHTKGLAHRDVKPENIMVSRQEASGLRARVMDFGLARTTGSTSITKTGMLVGTMSYMSPEQVSGREVDARSDLYSLATVLYECVTGDVPFGGDLQAMLYRVVHELPQSPRERGVEIDPDLDRIIMSGLAKDPAERPRRGSDLVNALKRYRSGIQDSVRDKSVMVTRVVQAPRVALSPFVGRKHEVKELQLRLNAAVAGECQFAVISGDAGVGKTRLVDDLEKIAQARQIRVLHGRFAEQDGSFPYHGFCEAIQEYFRQKETTTASSGMIDFSDLAAELVSLFPMLGEIDAIRTDSSGSGARAASAPESHLPDNRTQVFELLARTLVRLAEGKPLVLVLEDLHGAEVSIEALRYIVRRLGPTPTLILATFRSTEIDRRHPLSTMLEGFQRDRHFSHIELKPLSVSEHRELVSTLIGGAQLTGELAERLFEATEGNPFFTKELVRSLMDAGEIIRDETGVWSLSAGGNITSEALPATIQQAVENRVARLSEDLRTVLATAAVMGKVFDFRDLEDLSEDETDLDEAVDRLIKEGLIEEERQSRGDTLAFTSGVVREVLYAELPRRKRRSLHRKYAARLEKRHGGKLERVYPQLVYHFSEGDVPDKTVEYGLKHAQRSLDAFSPEEAIRSVKTALGLLDDEWEGDPAAEADARMLLAAAHQMAGDFDSAMREVAGAIRIYEKVQASGKALDALLQAARTAWQGRRADEARSWTERGLAAARAAADQDKLRQFLSLAATLANLRGEYDRAAQYQKEAGAQDTAASAEPREAVPAGGTLAVALANRVIATEPAEMQTAEEWEVYTNVFETLVTTGPQGELLPLLCERWEILDGGRRFVFHLRSGTRFQDGDPLSVRDVKEAFERSIRKSAADLAPVFVAIQGIQAFLDGGAEGVSGIVALEPARLEFLLDKATPIFPTFLADARAGIYRVAKDGKEGGGPVLVGTGPFRLASREVDIIRLERHEGYWKGAPPRLDALEFRHGLSAAAIASGLEAGTIDVAGDLLPADLERLMGNPLFRGRMAEAARMTTYFILLTSHPGAAGEKEELRRALGGVLSPHDLVWQTVGRFAQPAVGLIPPGMQGHDPGRRAPLLSLDEARALLRSAGVPESITLQAAVHPAIQDRYGPLLKALFDVWKELGVTVSIRTPDIASYIEAGGAGGSLDAGFMRWTADYNDPDNFTHNLFHSTNGHYRTYFSSPETDQILESARLETDPAAREVLYRKFEQAILKGGFLVPLFHDVAYRLSSPQVRGLRVGGTYPSVNYAEIGKSSAAAAQSLRQEAGVIRVPMATEVESLDPALIDAVEGQEVMPCIYESLTRVQEGQIVPHLASEFHVEEGGKKYRFRLRDNVRFHDGRRLTARDVRFTFERLLTSKGIKNVNYGVIRGAEALMEGKSSELSGFQIHSAVEFTIELDSPIAFFPVLLSDSCIAILPEGTPATIGSSRTEGVTGTGPFRLVRFEPGRIVELERNPSYWREGLPRSQGVIFEFNVPPAEILDGFKSGRFTVASNLSPSDVEGLRRDSTYAAGYREAPSLSIYFALFNRHRGPLADQAFRRRLVDAEGLPALVRQTMGRRAIPAHGWLPPGLLGHEPAGERPAATGKAEPRTDATPIELTAAVHPVFTGEYAAFYRGLEAAFKAQGFTIRPVTPTMAEYLEAWRKIEVDVIIGRWLADYPDSDTFMHFLSRRATFAGTFCGSRDLDDLVQRGRTEVDPKLRHAIYREVEQAIIRDALLLPLFHEQVYRFGRPDLEGLAVTYTWPTVAYEKLRVRRG